MKLLIVDDSSVMRRAIEKAVTTIAVQVVGTAGDGEEALRMVESLQPDIVTLDITMPKMDGLTCLKRMLESRPKTKVLVVSALTDKATGLQAIKNGAKGFLGKPFTSETLSRELERLIHD